MADRGRSTLRWRLSLLAILLLAGGVQYWRSHHIRPHGRIAPASLQAGRIYDKVPGDPNRAMRDGVRLYNAMQIYRDHHGGAWPAVSDLMVDRIYNPKRYGYRDSRSTVYAFMSPDDKYSDNPSVRNDPGRTDPWYMPGRRPDGTPIGGPKAPGTRDIVATCSLYTHMNIKHLSGDATSLGPVGFHIVVWEDGLVEKVPIRETLKVPGAGGWVEAFRGQAGVPQGAVSFDDFYKRVVGASPLSASRKR